MATLTLAQASTIVDVTLKTAREKNFQPLTVAVLDPGGHLVAFKREDKSGILRYDIAYGKAWGALGMGFGSRTLAEQLGAYKLSLSRPFDRLLLRTWPLLVLAGLRFTSVRSPLPCNEWFHNSVLALATLRS